MLPATLIRWAGPAAVVGGLLWMVYGVFLMLEPWGQAEVYREELGYQLVTNRALYWVYALPGSLALILTALALLGLFRRYALPRSGVGKLGAVLTKLSLVLAVLSFLGTVALIAPLSFAGRSFGSLALGAAALLVGMDLPRANPALQMHLVILGCLGLSLLALQPLVWALQIIPASIATGIIALFGLGWLVLGYRLSQSGKDGTCHRD